MAYELVVGEPEGSEVRYYTFHGASHVPTVQWLLTIVYAQEFVL